MSYYEDLMIAEDASPQEIRRAYFKLIRKHPPEKEPEAYKTIRRAYETLSDPRKRQSYDAVLKHGPEILGLLEEAGKAMAREEWSEAKRALKRALVLDPGNDGALILLARCYLRSGDCNLAARTCERFLEFHGETAPILLLHGAAHVKQAGKTNTSREKRAELRAQAAQHFLRASELEPHNPEPYFRMAMLKIDEADFDGALEFARKAEQADGTCDIQDLEFILLQCLLYVRNDEIAEAERVIERLEKNLPSDPNAPRFIAAHFVEYAIGLLRAFSPLAAERFLRFALRFDPDNERITSFTQLVSHIPGAIDSLDEIRDDDRIIEPIRQAALYQLFDLLGEEVPDAKEFNAHFRRALASCTIVSVKASLSRLKEKYPDFYALSPEVYDSIWDALREPLSTRSTVSSGAQGCLLLITTLIGAAGAISFLAALF
jgi:tetratricopeptide (TPR) repeat protein